MMNAAVTFILPATAAGVGRERALRSLLAQTDPDWLALAIGRGVAPWLPLEARFYSVKGPADVREAGLVNAALTWLHLAAHMEQVNTEWIAVIGEDDTVSEQFVARVKRIGDGANVAVFRSFDGKRGILPHPAFPALLPGEIGSCVIARRAFVEAVGLEFADGRSVESFFRDASLQGARVHLDPAINYFVKDAHP